MKNNFEYFNKEIIEPIILSKYTFFHLNCIPKIQRCIFSIYLIDINKYNILFSYILFKFFLSYKNPFILNRFKRFPKKRIFYKKNNDLNFLVNFNLVNLKKIYSFLEFFLIIFLFSRFRKYCKKKVMYANINMLVFYNLDFLFFEKYLKSFFKFSNEMFFILKKMRLSLSIYYNAPSNLKLKYFFFKCLKLGK